MERAEQNLQTQLACPVCDRPAVTGDVCPNCETDLSVLRMLLELPPVGREKGGLILAVASAIALGVIVLWQQFHLS